MTRLLNFAVATALLGTLTVTAHADTGGYYLSKPFNDLSAAEKGAAKDAATARSQPIQPLVACADPANMPLSNKKAEGLESRILKLLAKKLDTTAAFYSQEADHRGMMHRLFQYRTCNLLLGVSIGSDRLLETSPIYRSTYVFAYRKDSDIHIDGLDAPDLKTRRLGVVEPSAMRQVLARHGIKTSLQVMYQTSGEPWRQVQKVAEGKLDIAAAWGPFAGYANAQSDNSLVLQPANLMSDKIPLQYSIAIGMRPGDAVLKYALDDALKHSAKEIKVILEDYDIPLVQCGDCIVSGDIPAHGSYSESLYESPQARFLKPFDARQTDFNPSVGRKQVEQALKKGESANDQMFDAVVGSDDQLLDFLVKQYEADPNALNNLGSRPLGIAARNRDSAMLETLLDVGAHPNLRDGHGFTPLLYAAHRNHAPSIKALIRGGAKPDMRGPDNMTPLGFATGERHFFAAKALLDAGADINTWTGGTHLTPLMLVASKPKSASRYDAIAGGMEPDELARLMIEKYGADVRARTTAGITALMIAAGHDNATMIGLLLQSGADLSATDKAGKTALDIAEGAGSDDAGQSLHLFESMAPTKPAEAGADSNHPGQRREGIWKSAPIPKNPDAQFHKQDPVGLANGDHIHTHCSINWVYPGDGNLYCFNSGTSRGFFMEKPQYYIKNAKAFLRSEESHGDP